MTSQQRIQDCCKVDPHFVMGHVVFPPHQQSEPIPRTVSEKALSELGGAFG